jgi:tetratricopeptide (TPR) repeat protein
MKSSKWLDVTEYALLAGSGMGSVAAVLSQQLAFTAAPVSLLLLVNLVNRRCADKAIADRNLAVVVQVEQRVNQQLEILERRVQGLPTFWDLASLRKTLLNKHRVALSQLQQETFTRLATLENQEQLFKPEDLQHLQQQQAKLADSVQTLTAHLHRTASIDQMRDSEVAIDRLQGNIGTLQSQLEKISRVYSPAQIKAVQGQIDHLNRRFNSLPNPVDTTKLRQELDGLLKLMGDMVSRRDLMRLLEEVEQIRGQQQQLDDAVTPLRVNQRLLRREMETLTAVVKTEGVERPEAAPLPSSLGEMKQAISALEERLQHAPSESDFVQLRGDLQALVGTALLPVDQSLSDLQRQTQTLDQQHKTLQAWMNRLPEMLDFSALRNQMKYLGDRADRAETTVQTLGERLDARIDESCAGSQAAEAGQSDSGTSDYELMFDLQAAHGNPEGGGRALLEAALQVAQSRITVVVPCPEPATFDGALIDQLKAFLGRGGQLDLGWGYLGNLQKTHQPRYIHQRPHGTAADKTFLKQVLGQLNQLKQQYPQQFRFKVLGTDENFLVCDQSYGVLGFHPVYLRSAVFPKVAVGLRTTAPAVLAGLVERFENPLLNDSDVVAYFNRALTRYELDDKQGALHDYTQVLQSNPDYDVAYNNRGLVRYELGNKEGAIADLNRAILVNPTNSIAYCNRGIIRAELGNPMGAVEDFSYAIHVDVNCIPAYFQRGLARTQMGNKMGAVEDFSDALRIDDQDASALFYRGMARTKLGDRIGAIRDLKEAARLFAGQGNPSSHQQALASINQIQKSLVIEGSGDSTVGMAAITI